jgi:hypothetical protein
VRPDPGEYLYDATGSMKITLFVGSGGAGAGTCLEGGGTPFGDEPFDSTMQAIVTHREGCCWDLDLRLSDIRKDRHNYCYTADGRVTKTGHSTEQTWPLGGPTETDFTCPLGDFIVPGMRPPQSWEHFCSGFTTRNPDDPYYYTARIGCLSINDTVRVGNETRDAYRLYERTSYTVASHGEQSATHWLAPDTGLPLANERSIELVTYVPELDGHVRFVEEGTWTLRSP